MRLKSFIADSIPAAMKLVRDQLGPDAVILSTESDGAGGKVKVTAAFEETPLDHLEPAGAAAHPDPFEEIAAALDYHRVPADLADRLLAAAERGPAADGRLALARALQETIAFAPIPDRAAGRPVMLIGPSGAGKTATAARICARARLAGRQSRLITMDAVKAGALAQITAFAQALGARLDQAGDAESLALLVSCDTMETLTLIDTVGCNPLDEAERGRLAEAARAADAYVILVMAAGGDATEAAESAAAFAGIGAEALVASKLDTTRRVGAVLSAADAGRLALVGAGVSPAIGDGLAPVDPMSLAAMILPEAAEAADQPPLATGTE